MRFAASCAIVVMGCGDNVPAPSDELRVGSPCPAEVARFVNDAWIDAHPEPGDNKWARATYFIGDVAAGRWLDEPRYLDYARQWTRRHGAHLNDGVDTRLADNHAAGQVYLSLFELDGDVDLVKDITASISRVVTDSQRDDWYWIDAQFMAAPVFAHLAALTSEPRYADTMVELWADARDRRGLWDASRGLWYRDESFVYPDAHTPSGKPIFWARGNGWVIASLVGVLQQLPADSPHRPLYEDMLVTMSASLAAVQRDDGLWNVSLGDATDRAGPETSGTLFFTYALAYGIRVGILDRATYAPVVDRAWRAVVSTAIRADGELGYVQGIGDSPMSSQPITLLYSTHDYGVGALLLAATQVGELGLDDDIECSP